MPRMLSLREIGREYFGISREAVWKRLRKGDLRGLPHFTSGRGKKIYVKRDVLDKFLEDNTEIETPALDEATSTSSS